MQKGVLVAIRRFPEWSVEIRRRALADAAFRALCDDLGDAEDALRRWQDTESREASLRSSEYDVLVAELAAEIATILEGTDRPPRRG